MNLDAMRRFATSETVDAVVIGTGAGGAPLLAARAPGVSAALETSRARAIASPSLPPSPPVPASSMFADCQIA